MERLTEYDEFGNAKFTGIDNTKLYEKLVCDENIALTIATNKLAELEDVLEEFELTSAEDLRNYLNFQDNMGTIWESKLDLKNKIAYLEQELAELKQKAIVLPIEIGDKCWTINCWCEYGDAKKGEPYTVTRYELHENIVSGYDIYKSMINNNLTLNVVPRAETNYKGVQPYLFATKAEAEQKLAEIKGEKDE